MRSLLIIFKIVLLKREAIFILVYCLLIICYIISSYFGSIFNIFITRRVHQLYIFP